MDSFFFFKLRQVGGLNDSDMNSLSHAVQYINIFYIYIKLVDEFVLRQMPMSH